MPKLREPGPVKASKMVVGKIAYYRKVNGITSRELATTIRVSDSTFSRKMTNPGTLTLDQLFQIARKCHFSSDDLMEIMNTAMGL